MHSKREKVYAEIFDAREAKFKVCLNTFRYYFALVLVLITICKYRYQLLILPLVISMIQVFSYSKTYQPDVVGEWMWCFLFAVISDLIVVDGAFIAAATLSTMTVGSAPDACGRCRNCWLNTVPQAIREASE